MKFPTSSPAARLVLGLASLLLAGCSTARNTADIGVSSPPPPLVGSSPITAYDDYARGVAPAEKIRVESVARVGTP